jgi:hypothetical protein
MASNAGVAHEAAVHPDPRPRAPRRRLFVTILAALLAVSAIAAGPAPAAASDAGIKVAIVVGPAGSLTSSYIRDARRYAAIARSHGASVVEIYTPNATWARVHAQAQDANLLVYLGHGNGFPNPYNSTLDPKKVDGLGLNPYAGSGNTRTSYYGEYYVDRYIELAPDAVVLLNHLCYSTGSSEPGHPKPTVTVARKRVDNFAAGFLRTGARAVFATLGDASHIVEALFTSDATMLDIFWSAPDATWVYRGSFASVRTSGMTAVLDPRQPRAYYRSVVGDLSLTAAAWRG